MRPRICKVGRSPGILWSTLRDFQLGVIFMNAVERAEITQIDLHLATWGFMVRIIKSDGSGKSLVFEKSHPRNVEKALEFLQEVIDHLEALRDDISSEVIF